MNTDELRMMWKRMDMVARRKKAERRIEVITFLLACLLIAAVAWAVGTGR